MLKGIGAGEHPRQTFTFSHEIIATLTLVLGVILSIRSQVGGETMKILILTAFPKEASHFLEALRTKGPLLPHKIKGVETCLRQSLPEGDIFFELCKGILFPRTHCQKIFTSNTFPPPGRGPLHFNPRYQ